ncbi:MAG: dihydrolipoyl dehydrogenase [Chloroflexota bacterium]|jgi:dihydrolipoamide dehydrogenase|nr:dihydrolipoyl dehydrogenase [Chloroflexota bacterium]
MSASGTAPYDLIVIGAGPGGYISAIRAAQLGLRTAIVERGPLGGVCLNVGCIPSKALLKNAEVVRHLSHASRWGITITGFNADYGLGVDRSRQVVSRLVKGVEFLMRKNKIDVIRGTARIASAGRVTVDTTTYATKDILIATGARPRVLPTMPFDGERILNSWQAVENREQPGRLVIVGGGAIGCEIATVMRAYGSEVTILEAMPHLLPREDEKVSQTLERSFSRQGITHHLGVTVDRATNLGNHVEVAYTKDGKTHVIEADRCLVAVSVQPNTENLGLDEAGVVLERGYVKVDERMATNVPGIWAIGDVTTTPYALAHVASAEGVLAAEAIAGRETRPIRYQDVPRPTFCFPQVASVGLTEKQARDAGHDVKIGEVPYAASGKSLANDETDGFVKLVIDAKFGEILGAHIVGAEATELLAQVAPFRTLEGTTHELGDLIVAHPTLSELVKEAALAAEGHALGV